MCSTTVERTGDATPLQSTRGLDALLAAGVPADGVRLLVDRYATWGALTAAPFVESAQVGGLRRGVRLPAVCPPVRPATIGSPVGCFDPHWPASVSSAVDPPVLVDLAGRVLDHPMLLITGARYPSGRALAFLDTLIDELARRDMGVCALADGIGLEAAARGVGRVPVALLSYGDTTTGARPLLCGPRGLHVHRAVVHQGGCGIHLRGVEPTPDALRRAVRVAVALSRTCVAVEPGPSNTPVDEAIAAASHAGRALVATGSTERIERSVVGWSSVPSVPMDSAAVAAALLDR